MITLSLKVNFCRVFVSCSYTYTRLQKYLPCWCRWAAKLYFGLCWGCLFLLL